MNAQEQEKITEIKRNIHEREIKLMVKTPMREGHDRPSIGSGFAILEIEEELEIYTGKFVEYKTYYILTVPHLIGEQNWDLESCKENNIRIFVYGQEEIIKAQVIAWEWTTASMLLKVSIPESDWAKFPIKVVELAKDLPVAMYDSKYLNANVSTVYFGGYPNGVPVANRGYISKYYYNYRFNSYTRLIKAGRADVEGLSGAGQSGAAVFNTDLKAIGLVFGGPSFSGSNSAIIVPIDVIIERFLKQLPELYVLDFADFELDKSIKYSPVYINRPKKDNSGKNN